MSNPEHLPLITAAEYVAARLHIFPSTESLRWFERQNRAELASAGAILLVNGRKLVNPAALDAAVIAIGQRLAARTEGAQ